MIRGMNKDEWDLARHVLLSGSWREKEMELNSETVEEVRKKLKEYSIVPDTIVVPAHRYAKAIRTLRMYPQRLKAYFNGREDGREELLSMRKES